jgi:chromosome segregation ATPase
MLKEELDDKTADAAALRAAIGERTSLWDLLKAEVTELQRAVKEREAAVANLMENLACKEEALEVQRAARVELEEQTASLSAEVQSLQSHALELTTQETQARQALEEHAARNRELEQRAAAQDEHAKALREELQQSAAQHVHATQLLHQRLMDSESQLRECERARAFDKEEQEQVAAPHSPSPLHSFHPLLWACTRRLLRPLTAGPVLNN